MKTAEALPETTEPQSLVLPDDAHNRALVESVHPPRWQNPTPSVRYNLPQRYADLGVDVFFGDAR